MSYTFAGTKIRQTPHTQKNYRQISLTNIDSKVPKKPSLAVYKKDYTLWPREIYPRNAGLVEHTKKLINVIHYITL